MKYTFNTIVFLLIATESFAASPLNSHGSTDLDGPVKVTQNISVKLDTSTQLSEFCYLRNPHEYVIYKAAHDKYYSNYFYDRDIFKGKTIELKAGDSHLLNHKVHSKALSRHPRRHYDFNAFFGRPEIYHNEVNFLVPYSEVHMGELGPDDKAYFSLQLRCITPRFSGSIEKRNKVRASYIEDVNGKLSEFIEFDGEVLFTEQEPSHY